MLAANAEGDLCNMGGNQTFVAVAIKVRCAGWAQLIDATHFANFSADV
jgi:hypothetical protein